MSGYRRPNLRLVFADDEEFEGLEVVAKRFSLGDSREVAIIQALPGDERTDDLLDIIASRVVSWNLLDDFDQPVPVSGKALDDLDPAFVTLLLREITKASRRKVDGPLETAPTADGDPDLEAIPMEPLPPNT